MNEPFNSIGNLSLGFPEFIMRMVRPSSVQVPNCLETALSDKQTKKFLLAFAKMNQDDVIYGLLLVVSIAFGDVIRRIESAKLKQIIASTLGVVLVYLVSNIHIAHPLFVTTVNAIFIRFLSPKYIHTLFKCNSYLCYKLLLGFAMFLALRSASRTWHSFDAQTFLESHCHPVIQMLFR